MKGYFVTGTDTGVGKTIASACLVAALRLTDDVCYWKPVQTGIEEDDDTLMVKALAHSPDREIFFEGIRLERPLSPHLSARLAGVRIDIEEILATASRAPQDSLMIVEGAGGVLVPLNEREMMIDLIRDLNIPAIVVARSGLGTINLTLLTLEALRLRGIDVAGVLLNGEPNEENRKAVEGYGKVRVIAEIPRFERLSPDIVVRWAERNIEGI
ncbi:MAG TPA: dethiobiotin synthase [Aridibacter sp.]|nr:dethiobiotin synthase [Aridibacter sp.]